MAAYNQTTQTQTLDYQARLADDARLALASNAHDATDCRELGLLLDLFEIDPSGSLVTTDPWNAESGDPFQHSPRA